MVQRVTVKEFINELMKHPMGATVVIASDPERNDFFLLGEVDAGYWDQYDGYGEFHDEADATDPEFNWEPTEDSYVAVCLTPEG